MERTLTKRKQILLFVLMNRITVFSTILFFTLSPFFLFSQEKAKPRNGDAIPTFLKRHNRSGQTYYRDFITLNKGKFGRNNTLKLGVEYELPPLVSGTSTRSANGNEPLFGKKLARYEVQSGKLKGACFYLVSGHGGPDPGAVGRIANTEVHEDEYAYDIMLRLARNLMMEGANVYIIIQDAKDGIRDEQFLSNSKRETCMGAAIPLNQVQRLKQRTDKINSLYAQTKASYHRAFFIHLDSRSKKQQTDVYFYYSTKKGDSKFLAQTLKNEFELHYDKHQPNRGFNGTVSMRNLYVLANTVPPSAFVELGNIQNSFDQRRFILSSNRQALANWLTRGFIKDYEAAKRRTAKARK